MNNSLKLSNQLCFPLYAAAKSVISKYTPVLKPFDLTYTQYIALLVIFEEKEVSIKDLGEKLFLDSGTISPLIKKLENKGYIKKKRLSKDERIVKVTLTKEGEQLEKELRVVPPQVGKCINLAPKDVITLYTLLQKLLGKDRKSVV